MMAEGGIPDPLLCVCKCVQESGGQEKREERKTDYQNTLIMLMTFFSPSNNAGIICLSLNIRVYCYLPWGMCASVFVLLANTWF